METDEATAVAGYQSNSFIAFQSSPSDASDGFCTKSCSSAFHTVTIHRPPAVASFSMRAIIATTITMMMMVMIMINHNNHCHHHNYIIIIKTESFDNAILAF